MQATNRKEHPENLIQNSGSEIAVLSSALIFGPNASGKTYLFKAFRALKLMIKDVYYEDTNYYWYEPFKLDSDCKSQPVSINIHLISDGILYDYSISYLSNRIVSEHLNYYPKKRIKSVFKRGEEFKGGKRKLLELLSPSSSYLALAAKYNDEICGKVRKMIMDIITIQSDLVSDLPPVSYKFIEGDQVKKDMMIEALNKADLGITDFIVEDMELDDNEARMNLPPIVYEKMMSESEGHIKTTRILLKHRFEDRNVAEAVFDIRNEESTGTMYMFGLMGPFVDSLLKGKTLLIDEFGSHLHPLLTRWLVGQLSSDKNPYGAQLIAITHDVGLIDTKDLVRRDQIFFTEKDRKTGSSTLYCLSDFKGTRKDEQILKSYLMGRYDAIPIISPGGVLDGRKTQVSSKKHTRRN